MTATSPTVAPAPMRIRLRRVRDRSASASACSARLPLTAFGLLTGLALGERRLAGAGGLVLEAHAALRRVGLLLGPFVVPLVPGHVRTPAR